jgi:hypothetical protein
MCMASAHRWLLHRSTEDSEGSSSCPEPSGIPGQLRGTLCTYFNWVAGPFQTVSKFGSLMPTYKTSFHVSGDTAAGYWECHYYDVSITPWTTKAKVEANASSEGQGTLASVIHRYASSWNSGSLSARGFKEGSCAHEPSRSPTLNAGDAGPEISGTRVSTPRRASWWEARSFTSQQIRS